MPKQNTSVAERRARLARLSLRLLSMALVVVLFGASTAQAAAPERLVLTGTNPSSPGAALKPRLEGEQKGATTFAVRMTAVGPIAAVGESENDLVTVYAGDQTCEDPEKIVAKNTLGVLEGEGIQVPAVEDAMTTFYATETNGEAFTSPCSLGRSYRQVTTPPQPPTFSAVSPVSPADDNSPHLSGSADPEAVVVIYTTPD